MPGPATVTVTVQVDAYGWGAAVGRKNSAWFGNKIASFDDDSVLKYREDGWRWQSATAKQCTTFRNKVFSVTMPVGYTKAQLIAAINQ